MKGSATQAACKVGGLARFAGEVFGVLGRAFVGLASVATRQMVHAAVDPAPDDLAQNLVDDHLN